MGVNISAVGLQIRLVASITYPNGITLTQFADDTDPFDLPSVKIRDVAKGLNSDQLRWSVNNPVPITIAMQPDTNDDKNLAALFAANTAAIGRIAVDDVITMTGVYADGTVVSATDGTMTDGMPASSAASSGRKKSKTYAFSFSEVSSQ